MVTGCTLEPRRVLVPQAPVVDLAAANQAARVGGGYVFVHRLLLDYFADLQQGKAAEMTPRTANVSPAH